MIATIRGKILQKNPPQVVIECGGLGYEIDVPMSTFYNLPNIGEEVFLETVMIVREDAQLLYGFLTSQEKSVFRQFLKVSASVREFRSPCSPLCLQKISETPLPIMKSDF